MRQMLQLETEITFELRHFKVQIERLRKLIINNPCDMTLILEKERERLREELPAVVRRYKAEMREKAASPAG